MAKVATALVVALAGAGLLVGVGGEPAAAGGGSNDWKQVDVGSVHSCAITTAHELFCWGNDANGQLGNGAPFSSSSTPSPVLGPADWKSVDAGGDHTCAIKTDRRLFCWGDDDNGQLGNGAPATDTNGPVQVGTATDWKKVALGSEHTCATKTSGRLYCWGDDNFAQLGDGMSGTDSLSPAEVFGAATNWKQVAGGQANTCASKRSDRLFCWGNDSSGQLGDGTLGGPAAATPGEVVGAATTWKQFSVGNNHVCAAKRNGRLFCWGDDGQGQLGEGTTTSTPEPAPTPVSGSATTWKRVAAGQQFTCAARSTGRVFCWGTDGQGQLGNGPGGASQVPVPVAGSITDFTHVVAGATHACARRANRRLFCWGNDTSGQLGDGMVVAGDMTLVPAQVVAHP